MSRNSIISVSILLAWVALAATVSGQEFNIDFGNVDDAPGNTYGAVAGAGFWNSFLGLHGTTANNLVAIDGQTTSVSLTQTGGLENLTVDDPQVSGDDAALLEDYLVTFNDGLESCVFLDNMEPGDYEVWIYAWMPSAPDVEGYTSVDQEDGFPHYEVGGAWTGDHAEFVTYSRHTATVGVDGNLDLHSGIVPGANENLGAALNGLQVRRLGLFADGFETGNLGMWGGTF